MLNPINHESETADKKSPNRSMIDYVETNINLMQFWPNVKQERLRLQNVALDIKSSLALEKKQVLEWKQRQKYIMSNRKWDDIKARKRQMQEEYYKNTGNRIMTKAFVKFITLFKHIALFSRNFQEQRKISIDMADKMKSAMRMQFRLQMRIRKEGPNTLVRIQRKINA